MKLDTYSPEWRRITEARWVLRECSNIKNYLDGVKQRRGEAGYTMLVNDIKLVRPHIDNFTKRLAIELVQQLKAEHEQSNLDLGVDPGHRGGHERGASAG